MEKEKIEEPTTTSMNGRRPLPEDLVVDILLMLPVESLLHFKCVCKHWYALIKSPSFIEKHFHHKNNRAHLLVFTLEATHDVFYPVKSVEFSLLPEKIVPGVTPEQKILLHLPSVYDFKCVAGPVNGLFLLEENFYGDGVRLGLWNPATREFWPLPPAPFEIEHFFCDYDHQYGLGFDLLTQDYKVLWIRVLWREWRPAGVNPRVYVCVYSSLDKSWKNLEFSSSCTSRLPYDAIYLNGVYYWCSKDLGGMYRIHSFDMASEQFGQMQGPDISSEHWVKLTLRGDSLALLASEPDMTMTSIYEMKQEGSWSKVLTVQPRIDAHWPCHIWENDKVVFQNTKTSQLVFYDPTTSQVTDLGFQLEQIKHRSWIFSYKESLALIKRENETRDQDNAVEQIEDFFDFIQTDRKSLFTLRGPPFGSL